MREDRRPFAFRRLDVDNCVVGAVLAWSWNIWAAVVDMVHRFEHVGVGFEVDWQQRGCIGAGCSDCHEKEWRKEAASCQAINSRHLHCSSFSSRIVTLGANQTAVELSWAYHRDGRGWVHTFYDYDKRWSSEACKEIYLHGVKQTTQDLWL